jgi:hypothetical protein
VNAVFLPSDHPAYDAASAEVMEVLRCFGRPVEVWGWDEVYLGAGCDDPEELARNVRTAVHDHTALTFAVGIGDTRERGKMATRFAKTQQAWSSPSCRTCCALLTSRPASLTRHGRSAYANLGWPLNNSGELAHKATSRQGQCRRYFGKVAVAVSSATALIAGASSGRMNPSATPWSSAAFH